MRPLNAAEACLIASNMKVSAEWLEGCVEFFCERFEDRPVDVAELCDMVKTQWLLADLRHMSPGCLPPNLSNHLKTSLPGVYVLQMNYVINIAVPAYQQLQKIKNVDTANIEATNANFLETSHNRLLKLYLTDGVQDISAVEYKPIRNFSNNMLPGVKIQIKGPVDCRRGVLMLEEKHVTVLGGEVDDLLEKNSQTGVLTRLINYCENPNTRPNSTFTRETRGFSRDTTSTLAKNLKTDMKIEKASQNNLNVNNEDLDLNIDMFGDDNFDFNQLDMIETQAIKPEEKINQKECYDRMAKPSTSEIVNAGVKRNLKRPADSDLYNSNDFVDFDTCLMESNLEDELLEGNEDIHLSTNNYVEYPIKVDHNPFIYIKQLLDAENNCKTNKTFIVKGQILKVVGKLSFQRRDWVLQCTIVDGSGSMTVNVASELLSTIIGYSPSEMVTIKKQISSTPSLKDTVIEKLNLAMDHIQVLDCLFQITYREDNPYIVKTMNLTENNVDQMKQRLLNVKKIL